MNEEEDPLAQRDEFMRWTRYRGQRVKVWLSIDPEHTVIGVLHVITEEGEVDIRDDTGIMYFCWPCLRMELQPRPDYEGA